MSTAPHCFGPWPVPQEAASEQPWTCAVFLLCLAAGVPSQGSVSQVSFLRREEYPWADTSIARAEPGHTCPTLAPRQRHAVICRVVDVPGVPPAALGTGLGAGFGEDVEQR